MQVCGKLYVVATPIGNLKDISFRGLDILKSVHSIAAEDTRHSGSLLKHYSITTPMVSLHSHNEAARTEKIIQWLHQGHDIALISDAGTPLISDPGCYLTQAAHKENIPVVPIPGASALTTALCASGLPVKGFIFEGFLPAKAKARRDQLMALAREPRTLVFYEAPHRIVPMVEDMLAIFGAERVAVIARELTKRFETIKRAPLDELQAWLVADANQQRGEFVVMIEGYQGPTSSGKSYDATEVLTILLKQLPVKQAAQLTADITGEKKNALYKLALSISDKNAQ